MQKIIILAGNGFLPITIIKELVKKNIDFFSLIISESGWDKNIEKYKFKVVNLGRVLSEILKLKKMGFSNIIMAGNIPRPGISSIKPDIHSLKIFPKLTKTLFRGGDNILLKFLISELENRKFQVLDIKKITPELFLGTGNFTKTKPSKINMDDIHKGKRVLSVLSKFDIGQSIIVQQGTVLGIESIEGTDILIKRCSKYIKRGEKATLVKLFKKKQDYRVDLPTVGLKTINMCIKNSIGGIAFSGNKTLFISYKNLIKLMEKKKLFLLGINE